MEFQEVIEVDGSQRTDDVKTQGTFESLMISPTTVASLRNHGYRIPSPVQMKAIPTGLTGLDMLVQAKSGTGKTLVFSILAIENLNLQSNHVQKMIVAPTREIATQIKDTIKTIGHFRTRIALLVGGTPVHLDVQALKRGAHIVVGTTGRICQMVQSGALSMDAVDLFVLDEADKLMEECFQKDINYLFSGLPPSRQVAVFSATYPRNLDKLLAKFMRDAALVRLNSDDVQLIGIKQYVAMCNEPAVECLVRLLKSVQFNQALVFCNLHQQCEPTCSRLEREGFLAAYISAQMVQTERDSVIEKLKQNKLKVLVSTDLVSRTIVSVRWHYSLCAMKYFLFFLTARGIDASSVNLVVNLETAINLETYFHRIGRAARYGGYGAAVTILAEPRVIGRFKAMTWKGGVNVRCLDLDRVPPDLTTSQSFFDSCVPFKASGKEQSVGRENNVAGSKSKAESPQILQDVDVRGQNGMAYDRETVVALSREPEIPLSEEMQDYLKDIGILTTVHLNGVRNLPSTTSEQVASPNRSDKAVNPQQSVSVHEEGPKNTSMTYDRQTVVSLSKSEAPLTEEKQQYLEEIGIATTSPVNGVKSFATEMAELNEKILQSKMADMNLKARPDPVPEEKPKKFKFVPSREKAKRKFYMRGELLGIRDSVSRYSWRKYAESKFDLSAEPFIPFKEDSQSKEDVNAGGDGPQRTRNIKTAKRSKAPPSESDRKRYSRKDMIAIQNSVPKKAWIPYVKSRWDTTQEPFELNQFLRCSFEERLRRQRQLEKKQRDEVIRSRQKAQQEKPKLLASARTPCQLPVAESSFDMFCTRVKEEYEKFREQRQTLGNLGAVVPHRDPPEVWRAEVDYHTRWLQNFDSMFKYDVYKEAGRRCEVAVETQLEELPSANSSPSPGSALETESAVNASCVAVKDWTASEQSASSERNMSEEGETGDSGVAQSAYPPEFSDDVNDDSGDVEDSIEQSSQSEISRGNTFESGMDEEGEVTLDESSSCDEEASVEMEAERLRPFVEAYRRNVDFHLVFSSYLWLLNRKYH